MCLIEKDNRTKQKILELTFDRYMTPHEVADIISSNGNFDAVKNTARVTMTRLASKYNENRSIGMKGYSQPYLRRRLIRSMKERQSRHGWYEYICQAKGRRMSCEYRRRDELGLPDIKTRNKMMYNSDICNGDCKTCHYKP